MNTTKILRRVLGMPASEHRPRLVEPILRGIAHPHTALTEQELAQVRADLELAEPKKCTMAYIGLARVTPECGAPAVVERLWLCGRVSYLCQMHVDNPHATNPGIPDLDMSCRTCPYVGPVEQHLVAEVPL